MKEWMLKHPWMTFFLVDATICNVCKLIAVLTGHGSEISVTTGSNESEQPKEDEE